MSTSWRDNAACAGMDVEIFYPERDGYYDARAEVAKQICERCPVRAHCLAEAMVHGFDEHGVWGGVDEQQRHRTVRRQLALARARDEEGERVCSSCSQERPLTDFHRRSAETDEREDRCKSCKNAQRRAARKRKRDGKPDSRRRAGDGLLNDEQSRYCPQCQSRKHPSTFYRAKSRPSGYRAWCKACEDFLDQSSQRKAERRLAG